MTSLEWSEVMSRTQAYIQLEEAMESSVKQSLKGGNGGEKSKSRPKAPTHAGNQNREQPAYKR